MSTMQWIVSEKKMEEANKNGRWCVDGDADAADDAVVVVIVVVAVAAHPDISSDCNLTMEHYICT